MEEILSQDEISALLNAVNEGAINTETDKPPSDGSFTQFDLTSQDRIIRGRMPALDIINDRFSRLFRITLSNSLRRLVDVSVESTSLMKFGEFLNYLPIPSCLNLIKLNPLKGAGIISIEVRLLFALLNFYFGGFHNERTKIEGRDFSPIEMNLIVKIINLIFDDLKKSWNPIYSIKWEYLRTEINPRFVTLVPPSDVVINSIFEVEVENVKGFINLVIPYSSIEPIKGFLQSSLQNEHMEIDTSWIKRIRSKLMNIPLEITAEVGRTHLSISELTELKVGDIIQLDRDANDPIDVFIEGVLKFKGIPVHTKQHYGVQIKKVSLSQDLEELQKLEEL
ncbi:flagellar motor switch protein FliM [bacterium]|nr:flagellar motor switch protein FliM [bacterium]